MKVLALNGSPRMKASSTYHMLAPLLEGMESAGAETAIVHVRRLDLEHCIGCFTCWVRTPGICIHDDAMADVLRRFNEADLVVFGTPLYHFTMSGLLKDFIDRLLPRYEPWLIPHPHVAGMTGHPERYQNPRRMFLVSPCGFPELENFDALVYTFKMIARMENWEYTGEILRPAAEALSRRSMQGLFATYYDLLRQAGRELIEAGAVSDELQDQLHADLFPGDKQSFYQMAESYWNQQMDRHGVPPEQRHAVPLLPSQLDTPTAASRPPADTLEGNHARLLEAMASAFAPDPDRHMRATVQFVFLADRERPERSAPASGYGYLEIAGSSCRAHAGRTPRPNLTISTPASVWAEIARGERDPIDAFTEGLFEAGGSLGLLADLVRLFPRPGVTEPAVELAARP